MPHIPPYVLLKCIIADALALARRNLRRIVDRLLAGRRLVKAANVQSTYKTKVLREYEPIKIMVQETLHSKNGSQKINKWHNFKSECIYALEAKDEGLQCEPKTLIKLGQRTILDLGQQAASNLKLRHCTITESDCGKSVEALGIPWAAGGCSYGDFIIRVLPLIHQTVCAMNRDNSYEKPLLLPGVSHTPWCKDFLQILRISHERVFSENYKYSIQPSGKLYFTTGCSSPSNIAHPDILLDLRKVVLASISDLDMQCSKRIYISRKKGRVMRNEKDLLPGLKKRGFEILSLEEHSVADQIKIFSQAEIIAGPHGAGHANILWAKPGTSLFEVFHPAWKHPCYSILSSLVGASYHYMVSGGVPYKGHWSSHSRAGMTLDVTAPPDLFFRTLDKIIESRSLS
jgi:hypothetical protein